MAQESGFSKLIKAAKSIPKTILDLDACRRLHDTQTAKRLAESQDGKYKARPSELGPDTCKLITAFRKAASCPAKWDEMTGTQRVRYCEMCKLQVYDFDCMSNEEAKEFIAQRENKPDATLFRRQDGKYLSANCPVGVKRKTFMVATVAMVSMLIIVAFALAATHMEEQPLPESISAGQLEQKSGIGQEGAPAIGSHVDSTDDLENSWAKAQASAGAQGQAAQPKSPEPILKRGDLPSYAVRLEAETIRRYQLKGN